MEKKNGLSPYERVIMQRIRKLIDEKCEGSQKKFVDKTGLNKGSVSQYVNGRNTPSPENAEKIASAFGVDVAWVLAYDAIPDGVSTEDSDLVVKSKAMELYLQYESLPDDKKDEFLRYLRFLQSES